MAGVFVKISVFRFDCALALSIAVTQLASLATNDAFSAQQPGQKVLEFEHTYFDVFASTAEDYVNEKTNMGKDIDGQVSYWSPLKNGEDALLTLRFDFPTATLSASLRCGLTSFNFGDGNFGRGSLWTSKDGTNWLKILEAPTPNRIPDAPPPNRIGLSTNYNGELPESVVGSRTVWLQARLRTEGGTNMAQFLRHSVDDPVSCFAFKATYLGFPDANAFASDCLLVPPGLVCWWPGDGNAKDIQSNDNGTLYGGVTFAPSRVGLGFSFNGVDGYVIRKNAVATSVVDNWALMAWVYWKGLKNAANSHEQTILYNGHPGRHGYGIFIPDHLACDADVTLCPQIGRLVALFGGVAFHFTGITLDQDAWNHVVLTRENGTLKLYKNGQLLFSKVVGNPNPPSTVDGWITIGTNPEYSFNGIVDEACIFSLALSESLVQAIYGAGSSGMCKALKFTDNYFLENGQFRLILKSKIGDVYSIEKSLNFSNWVPITTQTNKTGTIEATDLNQPKAIQQFYRGVKRIILPPSPGVNPDSEHLAWIRPGTFRMGSPASEARRQPEEGPQTEVTISQGFWMGTHEVTQGEYLAVMNGNPSHFNGIQFELPSGDFGTEFKRPVERVSWNDAVTYCATFTQREREAGRLPAGYTYRLPTAAEWEYACRAGTTTAFHYGPALRSGMANFNGLVEYDSAAGSNNNRDGIYLNRTVAVGSYAPNAWGLYDMHGNLFEWCSDWLADSLPGGAVSDPQGPASGSSRVFRGGSWSYDASNCRSAFYVGGNPTAKLGSIGFRVVLAPG